MEKTGPDKEEYTCPICLYIMVEPVTMPCRHSLCLPCYKQTVEKANLCCPICRSRISVWARKASKTNTLVDQAKWEIIKKFFPEKVQQRLEGGEGPEDEESDSDDYQTQLRKLKELSKPGEIRQEYEAALEKLRHQREEEAKKEEEASAALIKTLQQEEEREMEELDRQREELERMGREVAEQLQQSAGLEIQGRAGTGQESRSTSSLSSTGNSRPGSKSGSKVSKKGKSKQSGRPTSSSLTLNSFFSPVPRSGTHTAPDSQGRDKKVETRDRNGVTATSPYPYSCISPQDKIFYGLSPQTLASRARSSSSSSDEAPGFREHSYSTASARRIDLTDIQSDEMTVPRSDIESYDLSRVKSEPEDIFGPGPSGLGMSHSKHIETSSLFQSSASSSKVVLHFQPIAGCHRAPPKRLASGLVYDPPVVRALPRNLNTSVFGRSATTATSTSTVTTSQCKSVSSSYAQSTTHVSNGVGQKPSVSKIFVQIRTSGSGETGGENLHRRGVQSSTLNCNPSQIQTIVVKKLGTANNPTIPLSSQGGTRCQEPALESLKGENKSQTDLLKPSESGAGDRTQCVHKDYSASTGQGSTCSNTMKEVSRDSDNTNSSGQQRKEDKEKDQSSDDGEYFTAASEEEEILGNSGKVGDVNKEKKQNNDSHYVVSDSDSDSTIVGFDDCSEDDGGDSDIDNEERHKECGAGKASCDASVVSAKDPLQSAVTDRSCSRTDSVISSSDLEILCSSDEENENKTDSKCVTVSSDRDEPLRVRRANRPLKVSGKQNVKIGNRKLKMMSSSTLRGAGDASCSIRHWFISEKSDHKTQDNVRQDQNSIVNGVSDKTGKGKLGKGKGKSTKSSFLNRGQRKSLDDNSNSGYEGDIKQSEVDVHGQVSENGDSGSVFSSVKRKLCDSEEFDVFVESEEEAGLSQLEKDHLYALRLQEMYSKLDRKNIVVERFKGAKDQYSLRKKRKLK